MNIFNKPFFLTVLAFIGMIPGQLTAQLEKDLNAGSVSLADQVLEIKKEISGGGTIDLIDGTTERVDGICNFDKDKLQSGRAFFFDRIALGYATNAASGKEGQLSYNTVAPKELQNAIIIIKQDGRQVLSFPLRDINNIYTAVFEKQQYNELDSINYFVDDRTITMQLKFPPGVVLDPAVKHYVYLRLKGLQTAKKANA